MGQFLYTVLGFTFLLTFILGLYGASANIPDITGPMNVLVGPWPTISVGKCDRVTFCLNQIADFMGSIGAIIFVALQKLGAVLFLFYGIFSVLNSFSGFPFIGWFFGFLMFILAIEGFKVWRSGHTA
ncbi:hypothetical protein AUG19_02275 [archaeon 13_1_20CM_2_54_9]|nr:MAG: hypothetical protein AUJ07_03915 [Crenarchaeota archaeon 13_1_40CM_3_53_5]OLE76673.1 MAG: hypothetical protein AUG19_02275 [archaeon 13_1_20CM_2_54_9]